MTQWKRASDAPEARERIFVDDIRQCVPDDVITAGDVAGANPFRTELAKRYTRIVCGHIEPPDSPGRGIEIDETVLERYLAVPGPCYIPGRANG